MHRALRDEDNSSSAARRALAAARFCGRLVFRGEPEKHSRLIPKK
jgi:hypothetical protein